MMGRGNLWLGLWIALLAISCGSPSVPEGKIVDVPEAESSRDWFVNVATKRGITFQHRDGRSGKRFYIETAASGGGFLDFDQDGDLDIYLLNGAKTPGSTLKLAPKNALYENRDGIFVDVSESAGVDDTGYGMGLCTGDVDGDGLLDLFITNFGPDRLFRNLGNGRFEDITQKAGVGGGKWGTGCAFADVDGDGDLDLYVANYVAYDFNQNQRCGDEATGKWSYCRPLVYRGQTDDLYINDGRGVFVEDGINRGIDQGLNDRGFGVVFSDVNGDGAPDLYVANDGTQNRLYLNDGKGYFQDIALPAGFGFNRNGAAEAGMGIALGDVNGDGHLDPFVTNYAFETHTLYAHRGRGQLEDITHLTGLAEHSWIPVGWGTQFFDFDNDRRLDLAIANGHVLDNVAEFEKQLSYPQKNQLFRATDAAVFENVSPKAGASWQKASVSRALSVGDFNNDGQLDLLITNTNEGVDLLENRFPQSGNWVGFQLIGPRGNRFAIGAKVVLEFKDRYVGTREVRSGGSFMSQDDLRVHFGLGAWSDSLKAIVHWPGGSVQIFDVPRVNQYHQLVYASETP